MGTYLVHARRLVSSGTVLHALLVIPMVLIGACSGDEVATPAPTGETPNGSFELTVLHTSENHGKWEPFEPWGEPIQGGIARRSALVKNIRAKKANTLLLDSGDVAQGSLYFVVHQGRAARDLYNEVGYDAVGLGNHEFDLGPQVLADNFIDGANFDVLGANTDVSDEPALAGKVQPFVIKELGGDRVGLIGVMHDELSIISQPGPNVHNTAPVAAVIDAVAALQGEGVDKIIVISHMGYGADLQLAATVSGVDVIVGGHDHVMVGDPAELPTFLGAPAGPYPTVVDSPSGEPVLVVIAHTWGRFLGRLDITFDPAGRPTVWDGGLIFVDENVPQDPALVAKLAQLAGPLEAFKNTIIGQASLFLDGERETVRNQESNLGNLITDAMLSATANDNTEIALQNGGGIRASINPGDISVASIMEALPFGNQVVQFDLNGADIVAVLENGVSRVDLVDPGASKGRFLQVAGLRFTADLTAAEGSRVLSVDIGTLDSGFTPIDPDQTYRVVTNHFLFGGGDGFDVFANGSTVRGGEFLLRDLLMDYIEAGSPVSASVEGRITLITQ